MNTHTRVGLDERNIWVRLPTSPATHSLTFPVDTGRSFTATRHGANHSPTSNPEGEDSYWGVIITNDGKIDREINNRIKKTNQIY
jgi:hypothetical protein